MAGLRARKNHLVTVVKTYLVAGKLTKEKADYFELRYRQARTEDEQDEVTKAMHHFMDGWKDPGKGGAAGGVYAHLRRVRAGLDPLAPEEEDEDPPALREALARARVNLRG